MANVQATRRARHGDEQLGWADLAVLDRWYGDIDKRHMAWMETAQTMTRRGPTPRCSSRATDGSEPQLFLTLLKMHLVLARAFTV